MEKMTREYYEKMMKMAMEKGKQAETTEEQQRWLRLAKEARERAEEAEE